MIERLVSGSPDTEFVWLSDGIDLGQGKEFIEGLSRTLGPRRLSVIEGGLPPAHALAAAENAAGALTVKVLRAENGSEEIGALRALDFKGLPLGEARYAFSATELETEAEFQLPVEIRNDIARIEIAAQRSSGAVQLLDKRWRRRAIGVISGSTSDTAQPLLASTYYLSRALNPFADVRLAESAAPAEAVSQFLGQNLPMMILADVGNVTGEAREKLTKWIEDGGVLVRFAGPRLAASEDDLVPVRLRRGGRTLGGSLSWDQPQQLAGFSREGPFSGMAVPTDVTVTRQVLAEPDAELVRSHLGERSRTAPRSSPPRAAARAWLCCSMSPPTRAGRTCRSPAPSSTCSSVSSPSQATPPLPKTRPATGRQRAKWCRRAGCSTALALSCRRRRRRGQFRWTSPAAPTPSIRPDSMARRKD